MTITKKIKVLTKEEKIKQLETQILLMGLNNMAYTPLWNRRVEELKELKGEKVV